MDIIIKDVEYCYQMKMLFECFVLYDINVLIKEGSYVVVIGYIGFGKFIFFQYLNGFLKLMKGQILLGSIVIQVGKKNKELKIFCKKVGIVF